VVVDGEIADGVSGGLSGQSEIFVEARTDTQIMWDVQQGKSNVGTSQFIGVGGSMGITGDLSYGGVSAGATVTVFSPGSLYIGARSVSDVKDGVFTLNMTIGISIGIGGLELRPSIAFPVAPLAPVGDAANFILSGGKTTGSPEERAAQAATQRFDTAAGLLSKSGGATLDLMSYLQANPDVLDRAKSATDPTSQKLALAYDNYGSLPNQLSDVLAKEKALATRINADPAHITPADLALAADLRTQERIMIGKVANLGGKIEVVDGQITLAAR
jgi:hypothetical protein